jgi:hypothetical protein
MWTLKRKSERPRGASSAAELEAEIASLTRKNQTARKPGVERRLLELRHDLGILRLGTNGSVPRHTDPDDDALPPFQNGLPEIGADRLTPGLLRAGILRDGCLLVRGLIGREAALRFAADIDRAFAEREVHDGGGAAADGLYDEFEPRPGASDEMSREWIKLGGGVLAADSPRLAFSMLEMFASAGLPDLVRDYLGEVPLISAQKTTLRKAEPAVPGAWHQDGKFMGPVRALNLWLALSRCGDGAPGLDIVPRRLEGFVSTQTDEAMLDYQVSQKAAEDAAGDRPIVRPIFEPGDAVFFDDVCLHKTGSDPSMPNSRYAIENWFFGASAFPTEYAPIAV